MEVFFLIAVQLRFLLKLTIKNFKFQELLYVRETFYPYTEI